VRSLQAERETETFQNKGRAACGTYSKKKAVTGLKTFFSPEKTLLGSTRSKSEQGETSAGGGGKGGKGWVAKREATIRGFITATLRGAGV